MYSTHAMSINKDEVKLIIKKLIKHWPIIKKNIFLNRRTRTFSINQKFISLVRERVKYKKKKKIIKFCCLRWMVYINEPICTTYLTIL